MKIAVTGGSGFIGMAVINFAKEAGHEIWSFDHADGNDILGDLSDLKGAEAVIHMAGLLGTHELFEDSERAVEVNIKGSLRIMQWCIDNGAQYTDIVMPDVFPSIYTATKIASMRLARALHHSRKLRCSHVRAFNVFGPGQKWGPGHPQKIIPTFVMAALNKQPIPIWGDGTQGVDLVYVDDVARILVQATGWDDDKVYDAGTGLMWTVNQVADAVELVVGSGYHRLHLPMRDGEIPTKIKATGDGWDRVARPTYEAWQLKRTVDWYVNQSKIK